MSRQVSGALFADYVRTVRRHRDADWSAFLSAEDLSLVNDRVSPGGWYPMELFERIGLAILNCVGDWSFTVPYAWGRVSADQIGELYDGLIVADNPSATMLRLHGLRAMFFNFDAVVVRSCVDGEAIIDIDYGMRDVPEAAACYQAMGFYERLVELSGRRVSTSKFLARRWEGKSASSLAVTWTPTPRPRGNTGSQSRPPTSE